MKRLLWPLALMPTMFFTGSGGAGAADIPVEVPEVAAPTYDHLFSANFTAYGGYFNAFGTDRAWGPVLGGTARVAVGFSPNWSAQFDLGAETSSFEAPYDFDYGSAFAGIGGHLTYRTPSLLVGGMISAGERFDATWVNFAVEGQVQLGNAFLLYGQAGHAETVAGSEYEAGDNGSHLHFSGKYFFNPNLMIEGNVGGALYDDQSPDSVGLDKVLRYGARLEYRIEDRPVSVFGEYQGMSWKWVDDATSESGSWYEHTVLLGVRFALNEPTLWDSYSSGATLTDYNTVFGVNASRLY